MTERSIGEWTRLPHDPCGFFGLEADFDRRQLKRAYGKLIRQYKPDTHPAEFQQIRLAYEHLESRQRYGHREQMAALERSAWDAVVAQAHVEANRAGRPASSRMPQPAAASPSLSQRAIDDAEATFAELERKSTKSPQEFFVMAMLADVCDRQDRARFLKCLLAGMHDHPHDPGLCELLREYLRADVNSDQAPAVLVATAAAVRGDGFYELTEPLWERLLREKPFEHFRATLLKCEKRLRLVDERPRVVFYLRVLRALLWKADEKFLRHAFGVVERHGAGLDEQSDYEFEFALLVREYLSKDRPRIGGQVVRQRLDSMIRDYCTGDGPTTMTAVAAAQDEIARDSHGILDEFSLLAMEDDETYDDSRLLRICLMIADDLAAQTGAEYGTTSDASFQALASVTLNDMSESVVEVEARIGKMQRRILVPAFLGLVVVPPALLWGLAPLTVLLGISATWWTAAVLVYFLVLKPRYLDKVIERRLKRICLEGYESKWRPRLFRYLQSCGQPPQAALERLYETALHRGAADWMEVVLAYPGADAGLIIFGRAQLFIS
ncbi:MAG: J domain-containing protein [Planctomycetales bacterium]|nr:J domain-containing protein [Planctomycetales bacterium]